MTDTDNDRRALAKAEERAETYARDLEIARRMEGAMRTVMGSRSLEDGVSLSSSLFAAFMTRISRAALKEHQETN